jgi:hypothetical protein
MLSLQTQRVISVYYVPRLRACAGPWMNDVICDVIVFPTVHTGIIMIACSSYAHIELCWVSAYSAELP